MFANFLNAIPVSITILGTGLTYCSIMYFVIIIIEKEMKRNFQNMTAIKNGFINLIKLKYISIKRW